METLLDKMLETQQLSMTDAEMLRQQGREDASETQVLSWLAEEYGVPFSELLETDLDKELLARFPARVLLKHELLPLRRTEDGAIEIATSRLFATEGIDQLKTLTGFRLRPVLAPHEAIARELKKRLGVGADTLDSLQEEAGLQVIDEDSERDVDLDAAAEDASIIRFVNQVLSDAIDLRTTDIHVEPFEDELRIRYRIDGVLQDVPVPPSLKRFQPAIVSRIKILSHLDIAEKRLPQDGRIKVRIGEFEVDIRVSIIPMLHGEAVVMRLLKQDKQQRPRMSMLNMAEREYQLFTSMLTLPHGIALVTGPTGSGKSTTLYSALGEINDSVRKIITIEDPIEYQMKGVNQIQVSEKAGLTFARGLRSILRHDPDVILIGEIRDAETAQIAVQASLTGHLVFSTLHTNDAPGAPTRLIDMGVEPYLVASALEGVLAQRLVRVLCNSCKVEDDSPRAARIKREIGLADSHPVYQATGCEACRNTGFHGRRGVFEFMNLSERLRELILARKSMGELRKAAVEEGLKSLSDDGWRVVTEGATTVEEVLRVTRDERGISHSAMGE